MKISSSEFEANGTIPDRFTQSGRNESLPVLIEDVPPQAQSLVLILEEASSGRNPFTHWIVYNLDPRTNRIPANALPPNARLGQNDAGAMAYAGPKPGASERQYALRLFALDQRLCKPAGAIREEIEQAMAGHVIAEATLTARCAAPELADARSFERAPVLAPTAPALIAAG